MNLKKAIKKAKKSNSFIKNETLGMYNQTAKSLIFWLLLDTESTKEAQEMLSLWLESDDWDIDTDEL